MSSAAASIMRRGQQPRRLILVRHGETAFNAEGRFRGRADPHLTERGRQQAHSVANVLVAHADATLTLSPRGRARETAGAITQVLRTSGRVDDRFDDIDYGEWTGLGRAEVVARWSAEFVLWLEAPDRLRIPGGEQVIAVHDRVWAAIGELARDSSTAIVVTHDVCIRMAICALLQAPLLSIHRLRVDLASITEMLFQGPEVQLVRANDTSHLRHLGDESSIEGSP